MGLDDLVDQKDNESSSTLNDGEEPRDDGRAHGEESYFNKTAQKRNGIVDNLRDNIEVDGQVKKDHTLYVAVTPLVKVEGGVAFRKDGTQIVDLNGKDFTIKEKQLKVKYDNKSQISACYEIRVR